MARGLDTNVLVRFLLQDDPRQTEFATKAIQRAVDDEEPLVVSLLTVLETEWVLRSCGHFDKATIIVTFRQLLEAGDLLVENEEVVEAALHYFENSNVEFADCLMVARYQRMGCNAMLTFDIKAAKLPGAELLTA
jgi:predicted nucleic-acid-binding protein